MKISYEHAHEFITNKLAQFELKTVGDDTYYEMSEADFDRVLGEIIEASTKEFGGALEGWSYKYEIAWLDDAYGGRISTYNYNYAFVKFTD